MKKMLMLLALIVGTLMLTTDAEATPVAIANPQVTAHPHHPGSYSKPPRRGHRQVKKHPRKLKKYYYSRKHDRHHRHGHTHHRHMGRHR